ncbi:MAG: hypothetical protein ABEL51_03025 [Salinibacter sp.]
MADASPESEAAPEGDESVPAVERQWRPASTTPERPISSSEEDAAPSSPSDSPAPFPDASRSDETAARNEEGPDDHDESPHPPREEQSAAGDREQEGPPPGEATEENASPSGETPTGTSSGAVPGGAASSEGTDGNSEAEAPDPFPAGATKDDPLAVDDAPDEPPAPSPESGASGDGGDGGLPPSHDLSEDPEAGKQVNEEAFADDADDGSWTDRMQDRPDPPSDQNQQDEDFFTDTHRHVPGAEQVEEELQDVAYEINEGTADTDWTPSEREDRRIASMFARLASKVAEDMSYQRAPGDEFWDPRKIMRRQIDRRPLRHCKKDYTKRRLALLVDTSPSCRDEAVFYSKIATGALLRDDVDLFLCPNGRIDARFDPEPMRFVDDDRGSEWDLDGRVVLYFTDWDGTDEIVEHSRDCTLYWFDNCPPSDYWESDKERHRRVRLRYRGRHFHCPDPDAFRRLARKIRP